MPGTADRLAYLCEEEKPYACPGMASAISPELTAVPHIDRTKTDYHDPNTGKLVFREIQRDGIVYKEFFDSDDRIVRREYWFDDVFCVEIFSDPEIEPVKKYFFDGGEYVDLGKFLLKRKQYQKKDGAIFKYAEKWIEKVSLEVVKKRESFFVHGRELCILYEFNIERVAKLRVEVRRAIRKGIQTPSGSYEGDRVTKILDLGGLHYSSEKQEDDDEKTIAVWEKKIPRALRENAY